MRYPSLEPRIGQTPEKLYERIVKAQQLELDNVNLQFCVNDFEKLPQDWREEPFRLLRRGYPSPCVVDFILGHLIRGKAVQHLTEDDWLVRVEVARRYFVSLAPGLRERKAEEWAVDLGITTDDASPEKEKMAGGAMGADANAAQPPARPRVLPRPEKFVYEPEQETEILQQVCQFAPVTQDLIVQLYLSRETTPVISTVVARHAEGGVLSNCLAEELLYPLEWVRRRLLHLESDWVSQHMQANFEPDYDEKAAYLRRAMRDGLKIAPQACGTQCPERMPFNLEELEMLNSQYATLAGELQDQTTRQLLLGDCAEKVTSWLNDQNHRSPLQHATHPELLRVVEYRRRFLFYGLGDSMPRFVAARRGRGYRDRAGQHAPDPASIQRLQELVMDVAALADPRGQEFLRILRNGGAVEATVLRCARQVRQERERGEAVMRVGTIPRRAARHSRGAREVHADSLYRRQKGDGMLRSLRLLPAPLLEEAIRLLVHGVTATVVARFIVSHENLGNFRPLSQSSMRQYLEHLATTVRMEVKPASGRTRLIHQVAKLLQNQQARRQAALLARRNAPEASTDAHETISIRDVQTLPCIKQRLAALFLVGPDQLFAANTF